MKFIKENLHDIVRLMLNQIALGVFGYVLYAASCMANGGKIGGLALGASILSILFYMYILYATMQETGSKHAVRIEGNRMKRDTTWGLKVMALSLVPTALLLLVKILGLILFAMPSEVVSDAGALIFGIVEFIFTFILAPYNGLVGYITGSSAELRTMIFIIIGNALSLLPGIFVCWGSYVMGLHDKKLFNLFVKNNANVKSDDQNKES